MLNLFICQVSESFAQYKAEANFVTLNTFIDFNYKHRAYTKAFCSSKSQEKRIPLKVSKQNNDKLQADVDLYYEKKVVEKTETQIKSLEKIVLAQSE